MHNVSFLTRASVVALGLLIGGCAKIGVPGIAPTASDRMVPPANASVESVFVCAERSVAALRQKNEFWGTRISRRDTASGTLETGDYDDDNVIGFRVRLRYRAGAEQVAIHIKGAGPYFSDLGVDQALSDFQAELGRCLREE